jgi:hypothetical protein
MNATPERRQPPADEERTRPAVEREHSGIHAIPTPVDPRSPLRFPDDRGKHITAVGGPIENSRLGATTWAPL